MLFYELNKTISGIELVKICLHKSYQLITKIFIPSEGFVSIMYKQESFPDSDRSKSVEENS